MVLGDGCLYITNKHQKTTSGGFVMKHGPEQKDYLEWKAEILRKIMNRPINVNSTSSYVAAMNKYYAGNVVQVQAKRFKAWKKIFYKNNNKQIGKILKFIRHPGFALATWLMDDGSCTKSKKKNGTYVFTGLILYVCDQDRENCAEIIDWLTVNFNVTPKLKWQKQYYKNVIKYFPKIVFSNLDSVKIWSIIQPFVSQVPSMQKKFEYVKIRAERTDLIQPQANVS